MQQKTKEKIERRFEQLPLHHVDTSILLEPERTENGRYCRKYLQKVGYNYRAKLSLPVLSELFLTILEFERQEDKFTFFEVLDHMIKVRRIVFYGPKNICGLAEKIKKDDAHLKPLDRDIVACAIEDNVVALVTLDSDLIHNKVVEERFKIRVVHPKELV